MTKTTPICDKCDEDGDYTDPNTRMMTVCPYCQAKGKRMDQSKTMPEENLLKQIPSFIDTDHSSTWWINEDMAINAIKNALATTYNEGVMAAIKVENAGI